MRFYGGRHAGSRFAAAHHECAATRGRREMKWYAMRGIGGGDRCLERRDQQRTRIHGRRSNRRPSPVRSPGPICIARRNSVGMVNSVSVVATSSPHTRLAAIGPQMSE